MIDTFTEKVAASTLGTDFYRGVELAPDLDYFLLPFSALNIALMGDSLGVGDPPNHYSWSSTFADKTRFANINNLCRAGAKWTHDENTVYDITSTSGSATSENVIWNQYNKLVAGIAAETMLIPNVIFIMAGTNDYNSIAGTPATEFAVGTTVLDKNCNAVLNMSVCIRYVVENIWNSWPDCQVILATTIPRAIADVSVIRTKNDIIKSCTQYLAIPVIDVFNESGIYGFKEYNSRHFLVTDTIHMSALGGARVGALIAKKTNQFINI